MTTGIVLVGTLLEVLAAPAAVSAAPAELEGFLVPAVDQFLSDETVLGDFLASIVPEAVADRRDSKPFSLPGLYSLEHQMCDYDLECVHVYGAAERAGQTVRRVRDKSSGKTYWLLPNDKLTYVPLSSFLISVSFTGEHSVLRVGPGAATAPEWVDPIARLPAPIALLKSVPRKEMHTIQIVTAPGGERLEPAPGAHPRLSRGTEGPYGPTWSNVMSWLEADCNVHDCTIAVFEQRDGYARVLAVTDPNRSGPVIHAAYRPLMKPRQPLFVWVREAQFSGIQPLSPEAAHALKAKLFEGYRLGDLTLDVMEHRRINGRLWLRGRFKVDACSTDEAELGEAWVPGFDSRHRQLFTIRAKGC